MRTGTSRLCMVFPKVEGVTPMSAKAAVHRRLGVNATHTSQRESEGRGGAVSPVVVC